MADKKYKLQILKEIKQLDIELALKKAGSTDTLCDLLSDYISQTERFFESYDGNKIFNNRDSFLEDIESLKNVSEKICAHGVVWEADFLINAFLSGNQESILEKYDNFKSLSEALQKKLDLAQCDENGNLMIPQGLGNIYDDKELASQPECGHTTSGYFAPADKFERLDKFVNSFEFDEALDLVKRLSSAHYNESIEVEMDKLSNALREGEFEDALLFSKNLTTLVYDHNKCVEERSKIVKPRVLVVDDVPDILITIKGILSDICYVCTVTNHVSAMLFLENCHADLILLDIGLEEVDGFQLLNKIKKIDKYKETPVIFLTGNVQKEMILQAISAGINDYLKKPVDAEILIERVEKLLCMKTAENNAVKPQENDSVSQ